MNLEKSIAQYDDAVAIFKDEIEIIKQNNLDLIDEKNGYIQTIEYYDYWYNLLLNDPKEFNRLANFSWKDNWNNVVNELKHNFSKNKNKNTNINDLNKEFKEFVIHKKWKILSNTLKDIDTNTDNDNNNTTIDNENNSEWEKVDNKEITENTQDNSSWTSWLF